jgi:hypothetical protein
MEEIMPTAALYGKFVLSALNKEVDIDTDTLKVMLTTSIYVPDQDTHQYKSSVTNEVTGTGYTATGVALTGVTVVYSAASNLITVDANDSSWGAGATISAIRFGVLYDSSPATDATRPLIGFFNFTTDQAVANGTFTIQYNAAGIFTATVGIEA